MKYSVRAFLFSHSLGCYEQKMLNKTEGPCNILVNETRSHIILRISPVTGVWQGSNNSMNIYLDCDLQTAILCMKQKITYFSPTLAIPPVFLRRAVLGPPQMPPSGTGSG